MMSSKRLSSAAGGEECRWWALCRKKAMADRGRRKDTAPLTVVFCHRHTTLERPAFKTDRMEKNGEGLRAIENTLREKQRIKECSV